MSLKTSDFQFSKYLEIFVHLLTNGDLKFVRSPNNGQTFSAPIILDSIGDVGQYTSLAAVSGNPAISYYDVTNGDLKFRRSSDGGFTFLSIILDSIGDVGQYTSLGLTHLNFFKS